MGSVEAHDFGCKNKKNYPYRTLKIKIKIKKCNKIKNSGLSKVWK
jgi:hypothetical protein